MSQVTLNLDNIQGDILSGLPKKTQTYFFCQITDDKLFRKQLSQFVPLITPTSQILKDRKAIQNHKKMGNETLIPIVGVNIAFSHKGFVKLGIDDKTLTEDEQGFEKGQKQDAKSLGDKGTGNGPNFVPSDWKPEFLQDIHAVILISGDSHDTVNKKLTEIKDIFGESIKEVTSIIGDVRPGKESKHEHFGFHDGISDPLIEGFDKNPPPGPKPVRAGVIITGQDGDPKASSRPTWAVDGSYLTFRCLSQQVPEFNKFLTDNPIIIPGLSREQGSELLGARLVGRWKSGAPVDLAPLQDDLALANDPQRVNNFTYHRDGEKMTQERCPFAAHLRKTNPRGDAGGVEHNRIVRRGIQFGPEVTKREIDSKKTDSELERGLLFVCYSTSIEDGFAFIQKSWANNTAFPFNTGVTPGLDPLIGQAVNPAARTLVGTDPRNPTKSLALSDFVIPRGGEYFFSPSIKGLKETLATA